MLSTLIKGLMITVLVLLIAYVAAVHRVKSSLQQLIETQTGGEVSWKELHWQSPWGKNIQLKEVSLSWEHLSVHIKELSFQTKSYLWARPLKWRVLELKKAEAEFVNSTWPLQVKIKKGKLAYIDLGRDAPILRLDMSLEESDWIEHGQVLGIYYLGELNFTSIKMILEKISIKRLSALFDPQQELTIHQGRLDMSISLNKYKDQILSHYELFIKDLLFESSGSDVHPWSEWLRAYHGGLPLEFDVYNQLGEGTPYMELWKEQFRMALKNSASKEEGAEEAPQKLSFEDVFQGLELEDRACLEFSRDSVDPKGALRAEMKRDLAEGLSLTA